MSRPFEKLPIFEDFDGAASYSKMVEIIVRAPPALLGRYDMTLRNRLMHRGFPEGILYLEMLRTGLNGVRGIDGRFTEAVQDLLSEATATVRQQAAMRDAAARKVVAE